MTSGARYIYNSVVGYDVTAAPGENRPGADQSRQVYEPDRTTGRMFPADYPMNVVGPNEPFGGTARDLIRQGGSVSRALNVVPGGNAIARMDDYINNYLKYVRGSTLGDADWFKAVTIPPSVILTIPALLDRIPVSRPLQPFGPR